MRRPRLEPWSTAVILLCVGWSLYFGQDYARAGAVTRTGLWDGELWRALTTIFVHGGGIHLALNCLALYFIGPAVARGLSGPVFLCALVLSGLAGLAASLLLHPPHTTLVGISGGVLGLLGVILAAEWRMSRSVMGFFRQRNTRVIVIVLGVNAVLAIAVESFGSGVNIDHAAHVGGLLFGLIASLAYFGKTRRRPRALLLATALLLGAPMAYAIYPYWNAEYFEYQAAVATRDKDDAAARRALQRWHELEPKNLVATVRLAMLADDPALLLATPTAMGNQEKAELLRACLDLAERRFDADPKTARALVDRARKINFKVTAAGGTRADPSGIWELFAQHALQAGANDLALLADEAVALSGGEFLQWQSAARALPLHMARLATPDLPPENLLLRAIDAIRMAQHATGGLAEDAGPLASRTTVEAAVAQLAQHAMGIALRLTATEPPPGGLSVLFSELDKVYRLLAENTPAKERSPGYRLLRAKLFWLAVDTPEITEEQTKEALALYTGALNEAREAGDRSVAAQARLWFQERGLPVPPADLADEGCGD